MFLTACETKVRHQRTKRPILFGVAALLALLAIGLSQDSLQAQPVGGVNAPPPPIRLQVQAAAAPSPALKFKLLPELAEKTPGNAAILYLRAYAPEWYSHRRQKNYPAFMDWTETPLAALPKKDLEWLLQYRVLQEIDKAARKESCDWQMTSRVREDGIGMLMPEVQGFREIAALLALRARLQLAEGRFDDAVYTLQTGFSLGKDIGQSPTLISYLVGVAISQMMMRQVEEVIQTPKSPNLYWALSNLPDPLVDFRCSLEGERLMLQASIPELKNIETETLSAEKEDKLLDHLSGLQAMTANDAPNIRETHRVALTVLALKIYPEAKKALISDGRKPEDVEAMPVIQVVAIHSLRRFRELADDSYKWFNLPYAEGHQGLELAAKQLRTAHSRHEALPFYELVPALNKIYDAKMRLARKMAGLRCVEAVRLYAKENNGALPIKLDEINAVPVPLDPATGKSFEYQVHNGVFTLRAPAPLGQPANAANSFTYEITLAP